jgi:MFS family permease
LPLTLSRAEQPETPEAPRLVPRMAWVKSPLAVAGVMVAAVSSASFRMVGPLYGTEVGLRPDQIAIFLSAFVLGGAVAQLPVGWLADRFDRRWVLIAMSVAALPACAFTIAVSDLGTGPVMAAAFLFGLMTFPIYSISAAHAHDWAEDHERVELSAALMFFYALGAIVAPLLTSNLITLYGPGALFTFIAAAHLVLVVFGLVRMRRRKSAAPRAPYVWVPRTTFLVGRVFRRNDRP